jgi:aminoglycoside phosphotransferase (APT) family kinase protein
MNNLWDQTIKIDIPKAIKLIESQTDLTIDDIRLIGEGFDNLAFLVNSQYVFRFPRRESGITCMENEILALPYLAKHLSFDITTPEFIGHTEQFPFAGYKLIQGKTLCDAAEAFITSHQFAEIFANWLKELHSIPIMPGHQDLLKSTWRLDIENRITALLNSLSKYQEYYQLSGFSINQLEETIKAFANLNVVEYSQVYLHGDLYFKHIMVNNNIMPTGLIDWGDIHIGHPGIDLSAAIMIFDDKTLDHFFKSYGTKNEELMKVAVFRALCHNLIFLPYAWTNNHTKARDWCIKAISRTMHLYQIAS